MVARSLCYNHDKDEHSFPVTSFTERRDKARAQLKFYQRLR